MTIVPDPTPDEPLVPEVRLHGTPVRGSRDVPLSPLFEGRFGRLFRRLAPMPPLSDDQISQLAESMREPQTPSGWDGTLQNFDNPAIPSGFTYFGQFVDHDITFDPTSQLDQINDPNALTDFRTPRFDLDSLYGSGRADEPFQYEKGNPGRSLIGDNGHGELDLPRNSEGIALIGDPRNDENVIVSQLHLVFLRLHNRLFDEVATGGDANARFLEAQRLTRWTYQYVIVNDCLPRIVGQDLVDRLLVIKDGEANFKLRYYLPRTRAYMPVEFSAAAFRFGHSMIRGIYNLSDMVTDRPIFAPGDDIGEFDDLRGRRKLPPQWTIDWKQFFELDAAVAPQPSRLIDAKLVPALFDLPGAGPRDSLPVLNLKRSQALQLPSGQDVARLIGTHVLSGADLGGVVEPTPLWFYILKESELSGGQRLGAVGARIVAEVLLGMLKTDTQSYLNQDAQFMPPLPHIEGTAVRMADVVRFAGQVA